LLSVMGIRDRRERGNLHASEGASLPHGHDEELHEEAAKTQERLGHPDRAGAARERAEHAWELHAEVLSEQAEADERATVGTGR
jgi:hypothetical protein